jgi:hypothetical protein
MNYSKHYDYCRAHPVLSFAYMIAMCFCAVTIGHCLHLPRPVYITAAVVTYYKFTGGF